MNNKIKLAIIFGGMSTEHDVSIVSGISVIKNLDRKKYEIYPIYIDKEGKWYKYIKEIEKIEIVEVGEKIQEIEQIENIVEYLKQMNCVFPVLHGLYGEDGTIQGLLELFKIPYVGCKVLSSSICMDKAYAKIIFEKMGLEQAPYVYIKKESKNYKYVNEKLEETNHTIPEIIKIIEEKLKYPMFVKPSNSGSSVGIRKAENKKQLEDAIENASNYDKKIIVEQAIDGIELECAVLGNEDPQASCVGKILSAEDFYSFSAKYKNSESKTEIANKLPQEIIKQIQEQAIKAFKAVDGSGLARVDFFLENKTNKILINEINTMPGFTTISMYPKLWQKSGIDYTTLLDKLIER